MSESAPFAKIRNATEAQAQTSSVCAVIDSQTRHEIIAQAAYFRAQHRGFAPGHEQEDWCSAARKWMTR